MLTAEQKERHNKLMEKLPKTRAYLQNCLSDLSNGKEITDPIPRAKVPAQGGI